MAQRPEVILVPVDGSDGADAAAAFAAELAGPLGVSIHLLFVFPQDALDALGIPPEGAGIDQLMAYSPERLAALRERRANEVFAKARGTLGEFALAIDETVLDGDPAAAILAHADSLRNPVIVMGSRGLSRVAEILVGSVSHRVIHHARCPVTIVRPQIRPGPAAGA